MQDKFLPRRHAITRFGRGGFYFGDMSHQGSLLVTPSGMRALNAPSMAEVTPDMIALLAVEKTDIDFLLVGTGKSIAPAPPVISSWLKAQAIGFDVMDTPAAIRTYNVVLDEGRRFAAILIALD